MSDYQVRLIVLGALVAIFAIILGAVEAIRLQNDAMVACVSAGGSFTDRGVCVGKNHEMSSHPFWQGDK